MNPILNTSGLIRSSLMLNYQSVRHLSLKHKLKEPFRKPVWQPMAPSKLYRIKKPEKLSAEEIAQREHLKYTYAINMKSIVSFLNNEFYLPSLSAGGRTQEEVAAEEAEQNILLEENERDNKMVADVRAARMKEFVAQRDAEYIAEQMKLEEMKRQKGRELDILVRQEIENSKTFITKDNLDDRIEKALLNKTEY